MWSASHRVITTIDEFVDPVASARTTPMSLRPGAIRAELVRVDLGDVVVEVGDYSFPIATRGESLADRITMLAPLRRSVSGHFNGEALAPGVLHAYGEVAEVAGATGPAEFALMCFTPQALSQKAETLGVEVDLPSRGRFRAVRAVEWPRLRETFDTVRRRALDPSEGTSSEFEATAISDLLVGLAVRALGAENRGGTLVPHTRLNSVHIAHVCEDHAARKRHHGITLADLCDASGASERRVRHAFHECYGMSPTAYLRIAALHEARRALLTGPPTRDAVSRAASDFGFWHLSRFAGQYRALFGESPSETLDLRSHAAAG